MGRFPAAHKDEWVACNVDRELCERKKPDHGHTISKIRISHASACEGGPHPSCNSCAAAPSYDEYKPPLSILPAQKWWRWLFKLPRIPRVRHALSASTEPIVRLWDSGFNMPHYTELTKYILFNQGRKIGFPGGRLPACPMGRNPSDQLRYKAERRRYKRKALSKKLWTPAPFWKQGLPCHKCCQWLESQAPGRN